MMSSARERAGQQRLGGEHPGAGPRSPRWTPQGRGAGEAGAHAALLRRSQGDLRDSHRESTAPGTRGKADNPAKMSVFALVFPGIG